MLLVSLALVLAVSGLAPEARADAPAGQMTWAVHATIVPAWLDPAETTVGTAFMALWAIHDAVVKPLPGKSMAPALAESWSASADGLVYEFVLRKGVRFHHGEPVTAEDVKFSFERYKGIFARTLKDRVAAVETPDPGRVRFRLKQAWPDFMTFYGTHTTSAGWVVPKKYVEKVGDEGFRKAPVGAGPYRFVSYTPGIELVLEAVDGYWRKTPSVKRLVFRVVPDPATRLVTLKRGEADVAYLIAGELAEELKRTPGLTLTPVFPSTHWLYFADQWDPKSPWYDQRVRLAANLALDRDGVNQAATFGLSKLNWSIVPSTFDFFWQPPAYPHDPARAKRLLAEAGYPNGFDAGDYVCDMQAAPWGEAIITGWNAVGIRLKLRPLERAAFFKAFSAKQLRGVVHVFSGDFGNAATRLEAYVASGGAYAYGAHPDLDALFRQQAAELDRTKREGLLHRIQQLVHERAMFAPLWELAFLHGVGPRVDAPALGLLGRYGLSAPYEDVKLRAK
jgi:peptide/nickel transport system substrate-binding protein